MHMYPLYRLLACFRSRNCVHTHFERLFSSCGFWALENRVTARCAMVSHVAESILRFVLKYQRYSNVLR